MSAHSEKQPGERSNRWWKNPGWWQVIATIFLAPLTVCFIEAWSASNIPSAIITIPEEWLKELHDRFCTVDTDSLIAQPSYVDPQDEKSSLSGRSDELLASVGRLEGVPLMLELQNLTQPPARYRLIAESLEQLINEGMVFPPEMLLKIGNSSFAIGDYERAERFYWRVPRNDQDLRYITPFEIAMLNLGVVRGVWGDELGRTEFIDFVQSYRAGRLRLVGVS